MKTMASSGSVRSALISAALLLAPVSHAVPLYYTFEGNVVYSAAASHPLGTPVRFTFLVDRDGDGQMMDGAGTLTPVADFAETSTWYVDYFYASYVGGSALTTDNPASPLRQSWFHGMDLRRDEEVYSSLRGSNSDRSGSDLIDIWSYSLHFRDWHVGMSLLGENLVHNAPGEGNTSFSSALTLTSISETEPVAAIPEPSTLSFMGLGLLGLCAAFRKGRPRHRTGR